MAAHAAPALSGGADVDEQALCDCCDRPAWPTSVLCDALAVAAPAVTWGAWVVGDVPSRVAPM
jgi:hypothetical protein